MRLEGALHEVLARLEPPSADEEDEILFVATPWSPEARCVVAPWGDDGAAPRELAARGFAYFLEVSVALEVLGLPEAASADAITKARLLLHYAETDAYPDWVYALPGGGGAPPGAALEVQPVALGDVLRHWARYELDDSLYTDVARPLHTGTRVLVVPFEGAAPVVPDGMAYLLGIEQVRDVVEGLEAQVGRPLTDAERVQAVAHYAAHDAFLDPSRLGEG